MQMFSPISVDRFARLLCASAHSNPRDAVSAD
jgi:hypothetical protein